MLEELLGIPVREVARDVVLEGDGGIGGVRIDADDCDGSKPL